MKYVVKMRNPKSGRVETYKTEAKDRADLQLGLDFWTQEAGYKLISVNESPAPQGGEIQ